MVIRTNEVKEAGVERGGDAGVAVRREFQFPGDLWLPRRENRCRQPPNNHTSYDYHTPGVYTRAPYLPHSFAFSLSLSLSLSLVRTRALPRPSLSLSLSWPSSSLLALLQIARHTLPRFAWEKLPGIWIIARYSFSFWRGSNYYSLFLRLRFKLS